MATQADAVVKLLKDPEEVFWGYLPQSESLMESLGHLTNFFTTTTATTTVTVAITTDEASPRVQRDATGATVPTRSPRAQNSPTPVPALVVEYPQVTEYNNPEGTSYNTQGRSEKIRFISQDLMSCWDKFPLQVLCDMANAVLGGDTGDLSEYRHLILRPNFREAWGKLYGN